MLLLKVMGVNYFGASAPNFRKEEKWKTRCDPKAMRFPWHQAGMRRSMLMDLSTSADRIRVTSSSYCCRVGSIMDLG